MNKKTKKPSAFILFLAIIVATLVLGWGVELALGQGTRPSFASMAENAMDPVPERYQAGLNLYLENCSSCHIPIPPEVLPSETWQRILERPDNHYGQSLPRLIGTFRLMMWDYLKAYSRPLLINEPPVFFMEDSRYFKALHPKVELPSSITHHSCVTCHPQGINFDYRTVNENQTSPNS